MLNFILIFLTFSILSVFFRFIIGNPITSSRFQTKFKFMSIPDFLNVILFFNTSKKPVSIHVIVFQILNYIVFIILILFLPNSISINIYFDVECFIGLFIIIIPLLIENINDIIVRGSQWRTSDNRIELSFEDYEVFFYLEKTVKILNFGTFINNKITFYYDGNLVGEGNINYRNKTIYITKIDTDIPYLQNISVDDIFAMLNEIHFH